MNKKINKKKKEKPVPKVKEESDIRDNLMLETENAQPKDSSNIDIADDNFFDIHK